MAPRKLLKQVFRNILHQKSLEAMRIPTETEQPKHQQTVNAEEQPQIESQARISYWVEEQAELRTVEEASDSSGTPAAQSSPEKENVYSVSTARQYVDQFPRLLQLSETMTASHLDTIETALSLLQALEKLSPHVRPLKQEMMEKQEWCEKQLREIQKAQAMRR